MVGRLRQKRHMRGRSRSSSLGARKEKVSTLRGSSQPLRVLMASPRPAPSTPATMSRTLKREFFSCTCICTSSWRSWATRVS